MRVDPLTAVQLGGAAALQPPARWPGVASDGRAAATDARDQLLLVLPPLARRASDGSLWFELQALNGLRLWADNFARVEAACEVRPLRPDEAGRYAPLEALLSTGRLSFAELPSTRGRLGYLTARGQARRALEPLIARSRFVCIALGHVTEDWGYTAVDVAQRAGRAYAVWTDRVEHRVLLGDHRDRQGWRRWYRWCRSHLLMSPWLRHLEHRAIARAQLGLFHGADCYGAYSPWSRMPQLVHDVHLSAGDRIDDAAFDAKLARIGRGEPLRIVYAGRAAAMKGGDDWVEMLGHLAAAGLAFEATWLGDGPLLGSMRDRLVQLGLADRVRLPGHRDDRTAVLQAMREADLFVFCHKSPESPRCLIEALASGTPIVGYSSPFAADLIGPQADDCLVEPDARQLADRVAAIARDVHGLHALVEAARRRGHDFTSESMFRHRSELIRHHLA